MSLQTEQWNILLTEWSGLHTARDSDDIPDGHSPNVLNVRIRGSHVRGSKGYELIGSRNETAGEVSAHYTFKRIDGKQVMVRVRDDGSSGTLEWYDTTNNKWYTLLASLTTGKKMGFVEFNTSTTNQMIFCNGVQNMSVWTGSNTRLTATVSGSPSSINVVSTADFPSSGTIIYNGTEVAYTSKTATTFVKSSGSFHDSAGDNDGVAEAADDSTHSGVTKGNILHVALDRLLIAGQPGAPNALDGSDEGAAFTFTGGANRSDSFAEEFFNIGGAITGLSSKGAEIIVLGEDGSDGLSFTYPTATTKAPVFREIFRSIGRGPQSFKSVVKIQNEVYFASRSGLVSISDLEGTEKVIDNSITRDILPTLRNYDFSEAASVYFQEESILLVACKTSPDFPGNDIVLGVEFYQDKEGNDRIAFTRFDWVVNDWAILENSDGKNELYFGSSYEQNSFKAFSTYQNDGSPRTIRYATKRFNFSNPFQEKGSRLAGLKGMIKDGTNIDVNVLYNAGFKGEQSKTIESTGNYVSSNVLNTIGAFSLGTNPIGTTLNEVSELKHLLVYLDLGVDYTWNDIQLIFESETDGGTFLLDWVGFAVDEEGYASADQLTI